MFHPCHAAHKSEKKSHDQQSASPRMEYTFSYHQLSHIAGNLSITKITKQTGHLSAVAALFMEKQILGQSPNLVINYHTLT